MGRRKTVEQIAAIIHNFLLAEAIDRSINKGLRSSYAHLTGETVRDVFKYSLDAAIRDIESHPRGKLFRRFLEYGPLNPDDPEKLTSDGETVLSDPECGECVQFIFSHMVNRFKGELAELLAIAPCLEVTKRLQQEGQLPADAELYFGDTIQERRRIKNKSEMKWGEFTKGADGLIVSDLNEPSQNGMCALKVHGIIEVKSMPLPEAKLIAQLDHHRVRLLGGVRLNKVACESKQTLPEKHPVYINVVPSTWKLSREWQRKDTKIGWQLLTPDATEPPVPTLIEKKQNCWAITLDWSKEALEQAAYEMTFWYMSQVGKVIYGSKPLPKEWKSMTPEDAGYNAIKAMLYYVILRYITPQQGQRAIKLYNAYSFGYPFAMDAKDMLWPEDFSKSRGASRRAPTTRR